MKSHLLAKMETDCVKRQVQQIAITANLWTTCSVPEVLHYFCPCFRNITRCLSHSNRKYLLLLQPETSKNLFRPPHQISIEGIHGNCIVTKEIVGQINGTTWLMYVTMTGVKTLTLSQQRYRGYADITA